MLQRPIKQAAASMKPEGQRDMHPLRTFASMTGEMRRPWFPRFMRCSAIAVSSRPPVYEFGFDRYDLLFVEIQQTANQCLGQFPTLRGGLNIKVPARLCCCTVYCMAPKVGGRRLTGPCHRRKPSVARRSSSRALRRCGRDQRQRPQSAALPAGPACRHAFQIPPPAPVAP